MRKTPSPKKLSQFTSKNHMEITQYTSENPDSPNPDFGPGFAQCSEGMSGFAVDSERGKPQEALLDKFIFIFSINEKVRF